MAENQCTDAPTRELTPEDLELTAEACAWLLPIAEEGLAAGLCDPCIAAWLNRLGAAATDAHRMALQ